MAKKLDVERIELARLKNKQIGHKKEPLQDVQDTSSDNEQGERKVTVIPPSRQESSEDTRPLLRTAAYIRVSTQEEAQLGSFEIQQTHFLNVIQNNPRYELVKLYCDEGISGTQINKRIAFQEMIEDAKAGKIDLILTKSITRFGRNIVDIHSALRTLESLTPPVPVIFETDGIDTSDGKSKIIIAILSALAEMESQQKSEAIKAGIRWRMQEGRYKFSIRYTLGYYRDYKGALKIEPAEAEIVRYIYDLLLEGSSPQDIADSLTEQGIASPKYMYRWRGGTIRSILSNEKYCGDVLYQKTYTKDFLTHKSLKNRNILPQYYWENCHPAIIPREIWDKAQEALRNQIWSKNKAKPHIMPQKFVVAKVKAGPLRGYFMIDSAWGKDEREQFINLITALNKLQD